MSQNDNFQAYWFYPAFPPFEKKIKHKNSTETKENSMFLITHIFICQTNFLTDEKWKEKMK